jgi:hypothetical protein
MMLIRTKGNDMAVHPNDIGVHPNGKGGYSTSNGNGGNNGPAVRYDEETQTFVLYDDAVTDGPRNEFSQEDSQEEWMQFKEQGHQGRFDVPEEHAQQLSTKKPKASDVREDAPWETFAGLDALALVG